MNSIALLLLGLMKSRKDWKQKERTILSVTLYNLLRFEL